MAPQSRRSRILLALLWSTPLWFILSQIVAAQEALDRLQKGWLEQMQQTRLHLANQRQDVPSRSSLQHVRANLHVHSKLSHDSRGEIDAIVAAAKRAGTDVLMFTEHPSDEVDFYTQGHRGMNEGVLLIPGAETQGMLVYPTLSLRPFSKAAPEELAGIVRRRGGHVFISHLEERMEWQVPGITGVEIYNTHADFKKQESLGKALRDPLKLVALAKLFKDYPQESFSALQTYPEDYLKRWDQLCQIAPHTGIAANDAHENIGIRVRLASSSEVAIEDALGETLAKLPRLVVSPFLKIPSDVNEGAILFQAQLDPYECSLRHAGTHLLVPSLTPDHVFQALEEGRGWVAFDWLADSQGTQIGIEKPREDGTLERWELGSRIDATQLPLDLHAHAPIPCQWRLIRNGEPIEKSSGEVASWKLVTPGIYRVEGWIETEREQHPWVLANPFYIQADSQTPTP
jgi:hypothetical protein